MVAQNLLRHAPSTNTTSTFISKLGFYIIIESLPSLSHLSDAHFSVANFKHGDHQYLLRHFNYVPHPATRPLTQVTQRERERER